MTIDLTPIQTRYLPYPLLGNALRLSEASFRNPGLAYVERDAARNLRLPFEPDRTIQYAVTYGTRPIADLEPGDLAEAATPAGSAALRVASRSPTSRGSIRRRTPRAAARALETELRSWTYELDLQPRGPNAVEDFVLNRRKGPLPDVRDGDGAAPPGGGRPHAVRDRASSAASSARSGNTCSSADRTSTPGSRCGAGRAGAGSRSTRRLRPGSRGSRPSRSRSAFAR